MQCYTELLPPTTITHAVALPFLAPNANNLVVAKTSTLQVFEVRYVQNSQSVPEENGKHRLVLVGEYSLSGTVIALKAVKVLNSKSGGEALLVASRDAKLSLVEWDPENHRISTVSIHYYEGPNISTQPSAPKLQDIRSILTVDPESRCAALKFDERQLAILPLRQNGDELAELEDVEMNGTHDTKQQVVTHDTNGDAVQTPYKASFVVPLTTIDPSLTHPLDLAFLYEYREPTFGVLYETIQASSSLLDERKDVLCYAAFTLDLEQRASTSLFTVENLPSDLWKIVPLPLPVGGALLIGLDEVVHVDQSGKTNAIAVNEFARLGTDFSMTDQSSLGLKLEDCEIELLDAKTGDLLFALSDGTLAILGFKMLGRNVGGLNLLRVTRDQGGMAIPSAPSCVASLDSGIVFVGSDQGDSVLLKCTKQGSAVSRKRSHAQMLGQNGASVMSPEDEEEDDDLYTADSGTTKRAHSASIPSSTGSVSAYRFEQHDRMLSLGPIHESCFGQSSRSGSDKLEVVACVGSGKSSSLAFMSSDILPEFVRKNTLDGAIGVWNVSAKASDAESAQEKYDNLMFVFNGNTTQPYDITSAASGKWGMQQFLERTDTEFEHEGETVDIGTLAQNTRVIQCRQTEVRTYDADLGLSQIIPMLDEKTDAELKIAHTSFCDPYLLLLRDDSSLQVLSADENGDVEPLDAEVPAISEHKWLAGCLYSGQLTGGETAAFLVREDGSFHVFSLPEMKTLCSAQNLSHLPPVLIGGAQHRKPGFKETLTELLVADLGPTGSTSPILALRNAADEITMYEPFSYPPAQQSASWATGLRFRKVPNTYLPKYDDSLQEDERRPPPLRPFFVSGHHIISVPGSCPAFIVKEADSLPRIMRLGIDHRQKVVAMHRPGTEHGFATLDAEGDLREYTLPADSWFGAGWNVSRTAIGGEPAEEVRFVVYHKEKGMYIVATCRQVDFLLAQLDQRQSEDDISIRPQVSQYRLHLLSANSRRVIDSYELPAYDTITCMKVMSLEVSEHTHEQKSLLVVGTGAQRSEDTTNFPAKGAVTVFDIINAVPDPAWPESGPKLHVVSHEETKGAVTSVESFSAGLIGTAQGQKVIVRGLKEDGSCLPVAFLDAQCQMTTLKTFARTGMWLLGDAWKGISFGGFTEEPYKLTLLGKGRTQMEVVCAEFLPFEGHLYILVVDGDMDLHVLQFDPENPKSLSGTRLIHRSKFHLGHFPTSMALLPSTLAPFTSQPLTNGQNDGEEEQQHTPQTLFHVLITTESGSIGLVTPVDETTYRRLGTLQAQLTSILEHPAGLNPREYRSVESEGFGAGARGVLDGEIVRRVGELGAAKRAEVLGRSGSDAWALRSDLEIIAGGGLGYL